MSNPNKTPSLAKRFQLVRSKGRERHTHGWRRCAFSPGQWSVRGSVIRGTESWFQCSLPMSLRSDMYRRKAAQARQSAVNSLPGVNVSSDMGSCGNSVGFPGLCSGARPQERPRAELLSDDQLEIDLSPETRSLATRTQEACRYCSAKLIVQRANGEVLVLAQPSERQEDCAWTVRFATANSLPY
jgi:hypothetical protein